MYFYCIIYPVKKYAENIKNFHKFIGKKRRKKNKKRKYGKSLEKTL